MTTVGRCRAAALTTLALSLIGAGCAKPADAPVADTKSRAGQTDAASVSASVSASTDLKALVPTPANATVTKGPDGIADGGTHLYFEVNGAPNDVMAAFKSALEGKGWAMTTILSSGNGGGGGATYTGTHGDAYGVFDGGGYKTTTYIDVCTWPAKPANPNCNRGGR